VRDDSLPFDKEADFARVAIKWLNSQENTWFVKYHASGYSNIGVPDLIGHIKGRFVAFELKANQGKVTPIQQLTIDKIFNTGGIAGPAYTMEAIKWKWKEVNDRA
jgi:Holliday junction resolvase